MNSAESQRWSDLLQRPVQLGPTAARITIYPTTKRLSIGIAYQTKTYRGHRGALVSFILQRVDSPTLTLADYEEDMRQQGINLSASADIGFYRYLPATGKYNELELQITPPHPVAIVGFGLQTFAALEGTYTVETFALSS
ncbi:hypothetical protein [Cellulosimicrobium cellulans]|uniref:hypothetical protein n=1 Tax=Cellulosimicrobium cellulans TaxID=1710 RepID=UPI00381761E3